MIKFGTRKNTIGFFNTSHVDNRDRYPIETTRNEMKVLKDKVLVLKS